MGEHSFRDIVAKCCEEKEAWKSKHCQAHKEVMAAHEETEADPETLKVLATAVRANEHLSRQVESLEGQLNERGEQVDYNADLVEKANAEVKRLHGEADYKGMFDGMLVVEANLREKIKELEEKIEELEAKIQKLENKPFMMGNEERSGYVNHIDGLESRLETQCQSIQKLQADNKNWHNLVAIRDRTIASQKDHIRRLEEKVGAVQSASYAVMMEDNTDWIAIGKDVMRRAEEKLFICSSAETPACIWCGHEVPHLPRLGCDEFWCETRKVGAHCRPVK